MGSDQSAGPESNDVARRIFNDAEKSHVSTADMGQVVFLNRGADRASRFFNLPIDRVIEVGTRVEAGESLLGISQTFSA
jgi:K+ transporter